ncbi:MAG: Stp1/IreP family PP2C-type Ser/Thr phosphatase [Firmicutes bacterium]|nr:Stp1/IreP family PP2C-type Ser/Thr phosphatase [Bacillota bacterium]
MLSVGFRSDRGLCRNLNEDAVFVLPRQQLYIVADGVGGHNAGDLASRMAVESIAEYIQSRPIPADATTAALKAYFMDCYSKANEKIYEIASRPGESCGMATTCVSCFIRKDQAYVVNVGDSRAYLIRDGRLSQISVDHSRVQELVDRGLITREEALTRPDRNMITRALGGDAAVAPDFFSFTIYPQDTILLCSDGLYSELTGARIAALCSRYKTMHRLTKQLVDEANAAGGRDNISVICIRVQ